MIIARFTLLHFSHMHMHAQLVLTVARMLVPAWVSQQYQTKYTTHTTALCNAEDHKILEPWICKKYLYDSWESCVEELTITKSKVRLFSLLGKEWSIVQNLCHGHALWNSKQSWPGLAKQWIAGDNGAIMVSWHVRGRSCLIDTSTYIYIWALRTSVDANWWSSFSFCNSIHHICKGLCSTKKLSVGSCRSWAGRIRHSTLLRAQ